MNKKDMENIIYSMKIEGIEPTEENIEEYLSEYERSRVTIGVSKNTQRILSQLKEGRETYEDVILRLIAGDN